MKGVSAGKIGENASSFFIAHAQLTLPFPPSQGLWISKKPDLFAKIISVTWYHDEGNFGCDCEPDELVEHLIGHRDWLSDGGWTCRPVQNPT